MAGVFPLTNFLTPNIYPWQVGQQTAPTTPTVAPTRPNPISPTAGGGGSFTINPPPQPGQGAFGAVPGPISYPTTPYKEATNIYAGLPGLTDAAGRATLSQINADFTPEMTANLWNIANTYGVQSGLVANGGAYPQVIANKFFGNQIDKMLAERQKGLTNYNALLAELGKMGVDPALAAQIADRNATYAAAPNPADAAAYLAALYQNAQNRGYNGGISPAGGTGVFQNPYYNPRVAAPNARPLDGTNLTDPNARSPAAGTMQGPPNISSRNEDDIINEYLDEIAPRPGVYNWPTQNDYPYSDVSQWGHIPGEWRNWDNGIDYGYFGSTTPDLNEGSIGTPWNTFDDSFYDPLLEFDDSEFWGGGY